MSKEPGCGNTCAESPSPDQAAGGGVYALVLRVRRQRKLVVGALGQVKFSAGFYCYVGSGRRGLQARLSRHLRRTGKRRHWHVDYLTAVADCAAALAWPVTERSECRLSNAVRKLAEGSVTGFGCSDCRCASHLYFFRDDPTGALLRIRLSHTRATLMVPPSRK